MSYSNEMYQTQSEEHNMIAPETSAPEAFDVPPRLPLDLRKHKRSISIHWGFILLTSCIAPLILYPTLHWGANLSDKISLSIASAVLGVTTVYSLGMRTWKLFKATANCRPLKSDSRWKFDFFHWNYLAGFVGVTIIFVIGLTHEPPSVRMSSLPPSLLCLQVGGTLVVTGFLSHFRVRQPFPVSSHPAGAIFRPGVLVIIEDIVAVDGGGDKEYRSALMARYAASPRFQRLIRNLNWFWGWSGFLLGLLLIVVISTVPDRTFAFGLGWTIPWIWAGTWSVITTYWVKSALKDERRSWYSIRKTTAVHV
ncbi:hypothetical protein N7456_011152 [Penicillium angulare]|uniref:Uncharacterized protein n=1 Tax=Penicillium angulare TaxID=116970 RepID=A0A9W9ETE9_9EURO|nr:hypothetical protein N7456_011152 [Penicillium angulare]